MQLVMRKGVQRAHERKTLMTRIICRYPVITHRGYCTYVPIYNYLVDRYTRYLAPRNLDLVGTWYHIFVVNRATKATRRNYSSLTSAPSLYNGAMLRPVSLSLGRRRRHLLSLGSAARVGVHNSRPGVLVPTQQALGPKEHTLTPERTWTRAKTRSQVELLRNEDI